MNLFTFDGAYFNHPWRNAGMNYPPPDAVQEFRIQTADFSSEQHHAGNFVYRQDRHQAQCLANL